MPSTNSRILQRRRAARERDYVAKMKLLEKTGIYQPKAHELTKSRKTTINKYFGQYGDKLQDKSLVFAKSSGLTARQKKDLTAKAKELDLTTARSGVFVKHHGQKRGIITLNKEMGDEFIVTLEGKRKSGSKAGKRVREKQPIASIDKIDNTLGRLEQMYKAIEKKKKKGERIAFIVRGEDHLGYSHKVFTSFAQLKSHLNLYKRTPMQRLQLYRSLSFVLTESNEAWRAKHPLPSRRKRDRRIGYARRLNR